MVSLIPLTDEELTVLDDYLTHKLYKLEQSGLTDSKCYPILYRIHQKVKENLDVKEI